MRQSRKVIQERRQNILSTLKRKGRVLVADLSCQLHISAITIRRDLDVLANMGVVERFHGGVALAQDPDSLLTFEEKLVAFAAEKRRIACAACGLVREGMTVYLNGGSTTLEIIRQLKDMPARIITNNAMAPMVLSSSVVELICTGGEYSSTTRAYTGDLAAHILSKVHVDMCLLGGGGISIEAGLTSPACKEAAICDLMVNRCHGPCVAVVDGSKVGRIQSFTSVPLSRVHRLITDTSADAAEVQALCAAGITVNILALEESLPCISADQL